MRIAKEGRKYGVYLGLVTQRPGELDPTIISQCNTLFAMRLANERDQALLRSAVTDAVANLLAFVPSLGTREVVAFGEGAAAADAAAIHRPARRPSAAQRDASGLRGTGTRTFGARARLRASGDASAGAARTRRPAPRARGHAAAEPRRLAQPRRAPASAPAPSASRSRAAARLEQMRAQILKRGPGAHVSGSRPRAEGRRLRRRRPPAWRCAPPRARPCSPTPPTAPAWAPLGGRGARASGWWKAAPGSSRARGFSFEGRAYRVVGGARHRRAAAHAGRSVRARLLRRLDRFAQPRTLRPRHRRSDRRRASRDARSRSSWSKSTGSPRSSRFTAQRAERGADRRGSASGSAHETSPQDLVARIGRRRILRRDRRARRTDAALLRACRRARRAHRRTLPRRRRRDFRLRRRRRLFLAASRFDAEGLRRKAKAAARDARRDGGGARLFAAEIERARARPRARGQRLAPGDPRPADRLRVPAQIRFPRRRGRFAGGADALARRGRGLVDARQFPRPRPRDPA